LEGPQDTEPEPDVGPPKHPPKRGSLGGEEPRGRLYVKCGEGKFKNKVNLSSETGKGKRPVCAGKRE